MMVFDNPVYSLNRFTLQNVGAFVDRTQFILDILYKDN